MTVLQQAFHWVQRQPWSSWFGRVLGPFDMAVQRRTAGRVRPLALLGVPTLLLTTRGRRSGQPRQVALLHVPYRGGHLVIGSHYGLRNHPGWSANLLAHPEAEITVGGGTVPVRATLLTGDERAEAWRVITERWPVYDTYAAKAGRQIRVFLLTPR
ncbi:deazaflavin-dependent oxidoreductase, nitroreductase family [Streptoalloteichus tenebrarius]|uniref:Deazaflavin-dependent oxidoreductase, nitroreductase family n=1 Tax=Streptoalloteichus tenebrarius (strain ATCC 17920 / DSM 40477 / JCM 4838 / CBS 697.72 / NBRC 16177 / NCIMB 11028 / NRRL B-12390 / A12253. 1 / ISP 5477) TaxID=1933 RepID=A0ABT1HQV4_STRSD|nr:nitroreductase family deazaflavin-dependent oxidoreductase [Streptoalloteichus tenebrarius]MCP2257882.1 deazaflavin-dependent oxidoreductase, nitroreductase family [Streptoalloteichus tenebrarius]